MIALIILTTSLLFIILFGMLMGSWARNKGYEYWNWFFASSIIGFIWLALSRNANLEDMSEELRKEVLRKGNKTGIALSCVAMLFNFIAMMNVFVSLTFYNNLNL